MSSLIIFIVIIVISQIFKSITKNQREAARRQAVEEQRLLREEYEKAKRGFPSPEDDSRGNRPFMPAWEEKGIPGFFEELLQKKTEENIGTQKRFAGSPNPRGDVRSSQRPQKKTSVTSFAKPSFGEEKNMGSDSRSPSSNNESKAALQTEARAPSLVIGAEQWDRDQLIMGVIMAEVLGPPKARQGKKAF